MTWITPLALLIAAPAWAQDPRVEISGVVGWTLSDGVSGDPITAGDGNVYNRIDPKDSLSYSLSLGYFVTEEVEIGFLWDRQESMLEARGTAVLEVADLNVENYHGYFAYNFGDVDDPVRPYVLGGIGWTRYGSFSFTNLDGQRQEVSSNSRFSSTWGAGLKLYPGRNFGLRAGVRWTPTYIKTDATGWWCDPFWGCWVVGNAQYSNQFELSGGVSLRF